MKLECLGSSSQGNAYILTFNDGSILLLEAGVPWDEYFRVLKNRRLNVIGCLITHEHGDHAKYIRDVVKQHIPIICSKGTAEKLKILKYPRLNVLRAASKHDLKGKRIIPYIGEHNAAEPFIYTIFDMKTKESLLFMTDSAYTGLRFDGFNYYLVECNYDERIVEQEMIESGAFNHGKYHMSLQTCAQMLENTDLNAAKRVLLIHLSNTNIDKKVAQNEITGLIQCQVDIAQKGKVWEL